MKMVDTQVRISKDLLKDMSIIATLLDIPRKKILENAVREYLKPYLDRLEKMKFGVK